ncbi:MAG: 4Fe-4S dicluster domain-containing protein, partial [Gemmatimonadota bacterium]
PAAGAAAGPAPLNPSGAYHYVRARWAGSHLGQPVDTPAFEALWNECLRRGFHRGQVPPAPALALAPGASALLAAPSPPAADLELQLYPGFALDDGRRANNGWLQELPDPITRISWGHAVSIAPRRFDALGLQSGDLVEVKVEGGALTLPAYRHAGMHGDQIAIALGYGRSACGAIGGEVGANAFALRPLVDGRPLGAGLPATLRRVEGHEELALAQGSDVIDRDRRPLVPATSLSAFQRDARSGTEQPAGGPSAWNDHPYDGPRWAMAIDLSRCNGCGKCVVGCQAENNIPVVGGRGIVDGREMSWLRIDRYYDAPARDGRWGAEVWDGPLEVVEEPVTLFEPMLCQHCENAPCETVCPFVATMHSADGLNQQIYNRCVGTRYCANNCPFKVRRYNWFEYSHPQESWLFTALVPRLKRHAELNTRGRMQMKNNPEVTVRSRGVMEKCSFCLQRICEARAEATRSGRTKDRFPDGAVVPACMEVCPTGAIAFGDVNDPASRVSALARSPRAMKLLEMTGVRPSVSYLTKVRHDQV